MAKEPKEPKVKLTSEDLIKRLRTRFVEPNRFVLVEQLANSTGHGCDSWIDAAVVSLWPSDGLGIDAYEIKVSRSDFTRELQAPGKNQWCRDQLSTFSYVCAEGVAKEDEIPEGCGLFVASGDGLKLVKAPKRTPRSSYSPGITAALARALVKTSTSEEKTARQEFFKGDPQYQAALRWQAVGEQFLKRRGQHGYDHDRTSESLAAAFAAAALDKEQAADHDRVTRRLDSFQHQMLQCFTNFAELAEVSLSETDELGKFLIEAWGGSEELVRKRSLTRSAKTTKDHVQAQREHVAEVARVRKLGRMEPQPTIDQITDVLSDPGLVRLDRIEKSPRRDAHGEALKSLLAPAVTIPLTTEVPDAQPGLCPRCLVPAQDCPCPPI